MWSQLERTALPSLAATDWGSASAPGGPAATARGRRAAAMVRVAACQYAVPADAEEAQAVAEAAVRQAAAAGADVLLLPELFGSPYFPITQDAANFARARPAGGNATIQRFRELARAEGLVLPVSFFEQAGNDFYNSVCMIDADGEVLGLYRKSHIPDGPGYQEKVSAPPSFLAPAPAGRGRG